ncbi:MAG: hypothetical protein Q8Q90_01170 [bacterium]|nr:hypothetical protein [bacterium]
MARKDVDQWAEGRIKTPEGEFIRGAVSVILCCMENRAPYTWASSQENQEEYRRHVEIACEAIQADGDSTQKDSADLLELLREDKLKHTPPKFQEDMSKLIQMVENLSPAVLQASSP